LSRADSQLKPLLSKVAIRLLLGFFVISLVIIFGRPKRGGFRDFGYDIITFFAEYFDEFFGDAGMVPLLMMTFSSSGVSGLYFLSTAKTSIGLNMPHKPSDRTATPKTIGIFLIAIKLPCDVSGDALNQPRFSRNISGFSARSFSTGVFPS